MAVGTMESAALGEVGARWPLAWRIALRELRGGLAGFRIFLLCLALGVAAIAGVGAISSAMVAGLEADGARLLGGDVSLRLSHRTAGPEQLAYLQQSGEVSQVTEMRAMAKSATDRSLVELKGVDNLYPLYGAMQLQDAIAFEAALEQRDGHWGAVAEESLTRRLHLKVGDLVTVGDLTYRLRGIIATEPDRGASSFVLGPRLMVAQESLEATGLILEGSLIRYKYRVKLAAENTLQPWLQDLRERFPEAGWRIRDVSNGTPGMQRFIERMRLFLTLVGLSALLVGGLGVANAVDAFMTSKASVIATLKCLGASQRLIFQIYLIQVMLLAALGVTVGLLVGALAPPILADLLRSVLPFELQMGIYPGPLFLAAAFGLLTALAFALLPLARGRSVPAGALFRAQISADSASLQWSDRAISAALFLLLAGLAILSAREPQFAIWFVLGAAASLAVFFALAHGLMALARRFLQLRRPSLRLALANLHRPGAATPSVVMSFGLGLTVLVVVMVLEVNLDRQISDRLPETAPAMFFLDIQSDQIDGFREIAAATEGVQKIQDAPSIRGRIVAVNGVPAEQVEIAPEAEWALRGDRNLTYATLPPPNSDLVAGQWWPEDYSGPPLISFDEEIAEGMNIGVGDRLTINVLGRPIEAEIHNLRRIDWSTFAINYVIVFDAATLRAAPHSFIASAQAAEPAAIALETAVTDRFNNVSAIRVGDALNAARDILTRIAVAIRGTAAVSVIAGLLVLAGAVAARHQKRIYEAVVLKVLGATRRRILTIYFFEYLVLGLVTSGLAAILGAVIAYVILTELMQVSWVWVPETIAATALLGLVLTLLFGLIGTFFALGGRPMRYLRNE